MKQLRELTVVENRKVTDDSFIIECADNEPIPAIIPGQFAQIKVEDTPSVYLRRPFSIHDFDVEKNTISFLIKKVGDGSEALSKLLPNSKLNVMFPLGNGFSVEDAASGKSLLVGGGVGIAPMYLLSKTLNNLGYDFDVLLGGRRCCDLLRKADFQQICHVFCSTEDGSDGCKGFVTNHECMTCNIEKYDRIYCCGPNPMMKAIAEAALQRGIPCEVSLENKMACGFGVCLCCVTPTNKGNECVCTSGPVFKADELKW